MTDYAYRRPPEPILPAGIREGGREQGPVPDTLLPAHEAAERAAAVSAEAKAQELAERRAAARRRKLARHKAAREAAKRG